MRLKAFTCSVITVAAVLVLVSSGLFAQTQPIAIFSTGVVSPGVVAADGSADTHYTLTNSADPNYPGPAALVVNSAWPVASGGHDRRF